MTRLFIDLDGVLADFDTAFPSVFGADHRQLPAETMWEWIDAHASFFRDLPVKPGARDFVDRVMPLQPIVLTSCPRNHYERVARHKIEWVHEHISRQILVLPVQGNKPRFMQNPNDILIDDFRKNVAEWEDAGGLGIVHRTFAETIQRLGDILFYAGDRWDRPGPQLAWRSQS